MPPRTPGYKFNRLTSKFTAFRPVARDYTGLVHPYISDTNPQWTTHYARNGLTLCGRYDLTTVNTVEMELRKVNFLPVTDVPPGRNMCRGCEREAPRFGKRATGEPRRVGLGTRADAARSAED